MRKRFQIILSASLFIALFAGFSLFTFLAQRYIYKEIVEQVIQDNQVIAEQIVGLIDDFTQERQAAEELDAYLQNICKRVNLPNKGFLCAVNPQGDVIAAPWLEKRPNVNLSRARLQTLKADTSFELRTMRALETFRGYAQLPDNRTDVVVSMPLGNTANRILVHQNNAAIQEKARQYVRPLLLLGAGVSVVVALLSFFAVDRIIRRYQMRIEVQNQELRKAFGEIKEKNEEIAAQNEELQQQRDVAAAQRDLIKGQKQEITQSIEYARHIQHGALPAPEDLQGVLEGYFIFFRPSNIVSGDFYWFYHHEGKTILTAVDCTGHGVPGAFMSMLGITFLNEAVIEKKIYRPADILEHLRDKIIEALHQNAAGRRRPSDGMDIALVCIDHAKRTLAFAGAHNPLYYVRNGEIHSIKGDRAPVGIHFFKKQAFTHHEITLEQGDIIYLFSDGFADQFGGPQNEKFKYKPFRQLLLANHHLPMAGQEEALEKAFEDWRGQQPQVDDVLVIGARVC